MRRRGVFTGARAHQREAKERRRMTTADVGSTSRGISIDRSTHLNQQPRTGHNRWHPEIEPALEVEPGETIVLETRDALDGYLNAQSTVAEFASLPLGAIHPLTGPVFVK